MRRRARPRLVRNLGAVEVRCRCGHVVLRLVRGVHPPQLADPRTVVVCDPAGCHLEYPTTREWAVT